MQDSLFSQDDHRKRDLDKVIHNLGAKGMTLVKASELKLRARDNGDSVSEKSEYLKSAGKSSVKDKK